MAVVNSTCCYCGTGCGLRIETEAGRIVGVSGDMDHPANFGRLCTKGTTLPLTTAPTTRALHPELRSTRAEARQRVAWDAALDHAAQRFADIIRRHGPDAVAFYVSGQLLTEDYFVFNKLARALVGTNNIDSNSRLCMSSAVSAYQRTLGADAPPPCYEDIDAAECLLIAGSNAAWAHPIIFRRILDARAAHSERKLIVIDPRATDTAVEADLHLAIEPGTDTVLFGALLHVLVWEGLVDRRFIAAHTEGFDAARDAVRELTPAFAARICGVSADDIVTAARWFGRSPASLSFWCQGLNQSHHGSDNGAALIHLHLATGHIGRRGTGPFSLTGQPNAMGGRETGTMASLLPGHRDPASAQDRAQLAALWNVPALPATPGKTAVELFDALADGTIKAVWIACTNPAQSLPDQARVQRALERAEFVVLQEAFRDTETARFADLLLPAATWGEKDGTLTNSERRIARMRAAVAPPGDARADWRIAADFALRLGDALGRRDASALFGWTTPADIFAEHVSLTAGRDCDMSGLSHARLDADGPQQWPYRPGAAAGTARLYTNHRFATDNGRARFVDLSFATVAEPTDARYPLHLNSGRLRDQWHGMSRTGTAAQLFSHTEHAAVSVSPADLARRNIASGDLVTLKGRRGAIVLPAIADASLKPGHVHVPMHWGRRRLAHAGANALMPAIFDPLSKQPELKHAAVSIDRAELPWRGLFLRHTGSAEQALELSMAIAPLLERFAYAALTFAGRENMLLSLQLAASAAPDSAVLEQLCALFALQDGDVLTYADGPRGILKRARIEGGHVTALALLGETQAGCWLREAMLTGQSVEKLRRWLFLPAAVPPPGQSLGRGRILCNCHDVSEGEIRQAVDGGLHDLPHLQERLKCGTQCGGCLPEIRRMLKPAGPP